MMWVTPGCQGSIQLPRVVYSLTKWLQYGNSVCNPIIYGLRNEEFRRTFRKILLRLCCKKVRLKEYDKNAHGGIRDVRKARSAPLQNEPGCESEITPFPQPMRNGYCQAIKSDNPIQLHILALKSLRNTIQEQKEDRANHSPRFDVASASDHWTTTLDVTVLSTALCNPAFEHDLTETSSGSMTHERHKETLST